MPARPEVTGRLLGGAELELWLSHPFHYLALPGVTERTSQKALLSETFGLKDELRGLDVLGCEHLGCEHHWVVNICRAKAMTRSPVYV